MLAFNMETGIFIQVLGLAGVRGHLVELSLLYKDLGSATGTDVGFTVLHRGFLLGPSSENRQSALTCKAAKLYG